MEQCRLSDSTSSTATRPEASLFPSPINSVKDQASASTKRNFSVIWFDDPSLAMSDNAQKTMIELEHIVGTLTIFDDADKCVEYVNNINDLQILLIVGESMGAHIVQRVRHNPKLKSVYILCSNQSIRPPWVTGCKPVRCIFADNTAICERIEMDIVDNSIGFDVTDASSISSSISGNHNKQEVKFMYGQLLKYIFTRMSYSSDHTDSLIKFFQDKYKDQPKNLELIKKFQDNYAIKTPIWCYTNYAFLYTTLNAALRTCDIDTLYTMGVFISGLHQQIVERHKSITEPKILKLYRGIVMLTSDFEEIKKKKGGLLSINSFLSTSSVKDVAHMFADEAPHNHTSVLFKITINQSMSTDVFYTGIKGLSQYSDEEEYLFTMGSVFRIESIEHFDGNSEWCVYLTLTTDHDPELALLTNYMQSEIQQPNLISLCNLMFTMGEFEKTVEISKAAIKASNQRQDLHGLYQLMGSAYGCMGQYREGVAKFEIASDYSRQLYNNSETSYSSDLSKIMAYFVQGKWDLGLTNLQTFMQNENEYSNTKYHQQILISSNMLMGMILQRQGRFSDALACQTKAYTMAKECLPPTHPNISECLNQLAQTYLFGGQTDEALFCAEESVRIKQASMLPEHVLVVQSHGIQEVIRHLKGDSSISESYTQCLSTTLPTWQSDPKQNSMKLLLLGGIYLQENKIDEALSVMDQYFSVQSENLSLQHPDLVVAYVFRGFCHLTKNNPPEALQNLRQGYEIATQHFGQTHPARLIILWYIAIVHAEQNNYDEALTIVDQCKDLSSNEFNNFANFFHTHPLEQIARIFKRRGSNHFICREYEKALSGFQNALKIQMRFVPHDHPGLAETYEDIAEALTQMKNYSDALINYQNARGILEQCLAPNDSKIAKIWKSIQHVHHKLQQYDDELFAWNKYLEIQMNTLPPDHPDLADTYECIGNNLSTQNKYADAISHYNRALDIRSRHLPLTNAKCATTYSTLGLIYITIQKYDDAFYAFNKVLEIQSSTLPSEHIDIAVTHKQIAGVYYDTRQYKEALLHLRKCLDIEMSSLSPDHLALADTHSQIGKVSRKLNNYSDALSHDQLALDIRQQYTPEKYLDIAKNWMFLGTDYSMLDHDEQSLIAFNQCLEIQLNVLSSEQIDIAVTHQVIALVYYKTRQYEEAVSNFQKCLEIRKRWLPPDHLDLAETQTWIGDAFDKLHNFSDALINYQCALDIQLKHLPATRFDIIKNWRSLGFVYYHLRRYEDSLSAFDQCLEIQFNVFSSDHIDLASTHKLIALVYFITQRYEEALLSFRTCLDIELRSLPSDHPALAETQSWISKVSRKLNNFSSAVFN